MTSYAALGRSQKQQLPHLRPSKPHGRSYSAASTPPHSAPLRPSQGLTEVDSGTETLLWAFAQFTGSFTVENALVKNGEFLAMKRSIFGGQTGSSNGLDGFASSAHIGGGSLGAEQETNPSQGTVSGKLASWIWGSSSAKRAPQIDRRRSSAALTADPVLDASHRRPSAAGMHSTASSTISTVGSLEERRSKAMNDDSYPVFSSPPSILAVDLVLEPGESKTCKCQTLQPFARGNRYLDRHFHSATTWRLAAVLSWQGNQLQLLLHGWYESGSESSCWRRHSAVKACSRAGTHV